MPTHCPHCNSKSSVAIGAANYYENTLVEHRCAGCGRLFCIGDRRSGVQSNSDPDQNPRNQKKYGSSRSTYELHMAAQQAGNLKFLN